MKRSRKTVFALLLALVMTLGLAAAAWATEGGGTAGGDGIVVGPVDPGNQPILTELRIPFTKTVKLGGNTGPGTTDFTLEICKVGNSNKNEYENVTCTAAVTTNGAGSYNGELVISGPAAQVTQFVSEGFFVREVKGKLSGWTYSDAVWYVDQEEKIYPAKMEKTDDGEVRFRKVDDAEQEREMTFENTYTYNTSYTIPDEQPISSPKTFDAGVALYGVSALLSLSGTALVIKRKKG